MKYRVTCKNPKTVGIDFPRPYALHKSLRHNDSLGDIVAIARKEFPNVPLNQLVLKTNRDATGFNLAKKF